MVLSRGENTVYNEINSLVDALAVRKLRNECCNCFTNHQKKIALFRQVYWYYFQYRILRATSDYRVFLFRLSSGRSVGFGALAKQDEGLYVTECVGCDFRGLGFGTKILEAMIKVSDQEGLNLIAEIWADNQPSIGLHEKMGFESQSQSICNGRVVKKLVYVGN
ncbi:MAG TPA: hypothetical protein DCW33_03980 [Proteobacteria bacterium]|nr:hypothetical protein [Pseudomonadota bacterium]|tara:strand:+ start:665 stop:1156 length:492 start_codon:yes stop_codon:yes gene_type:complete